MFLGASIIRDTNEIWFIEASLGGTIQTEIRQPAPTDGARVHDLIAECPPLDANSVYCNLLQCTHFAETSAVAEADGDVVGFIAAYVPPEKQTTLFVWQVAVAERARRQGLGVAMLKAILGRMRGGRLQYIQTTITEDNDASWNLFRGLAKTLNAAVETEPFFDAERHFQGAHPTEYLLTIGPIAPTHLSALRLKRNKAYA